MLYGFWSWVLVILVVAAIFYANRLPQLRKQAEEKLKQGKDLGKILLEKSKKELETKTAILAEKTKEKQKSQKSKTKPVAEETKEITTEDLEFMPKGKTKSNKK